MLTIRTLSAITCLLLTACASAQDDTGATSDEQRGRSGGAAGAPTTVATSVPTFAATDAPPGPVRLTAPVPSGFHQAYESAFPQGSSSGLRFFQPDVGGVNEGPGARTATIWVEANVAQFQPRSFGARTVTMGKRQVIIDVPKTNPASVNLYWVEAGVKFTVTTQKLTAAETLDFAAKLSVF